MPLVYDVSVDWRIAVAAGARGDFKISPLADATDATFDFARCLIVDVTSA